MKSASETVLPSSRGKRNDGALAPSANVNRPADDVPALFAEGFDAFDFTALAITVLAFDPAGGGGTAFSALDNFNAFDGGLWDAPVTAFPACLFFAFLPGLLAVVPLDLEGDLFTDVAD